jgi:ubiquitin C-terminal hydrolase
MEFLIKSFFQTIPESDDSYDLVAIALHSGPSLARGHFFCWVKNFMDNKWYVCDDSVTTPLEDVPTKCLNKSSRVYMLFYVSTILQHILLLESLTLV